MDASQNGSSGGASIIGANFNQGFCGSDDGSVSTKGQLEVTDVHLSLSSEEEERILDKLREVVRKCTLVDPFKRPTAGEIQKILNRVDS